MARSQSDSTVRRITSEFLSFRDFVDAALFHPEWGYYSTGRVRFGATGDYETYPDALSPLFGEMVGAHAFRQWKRFGEPAHFEIAEIGAGNGQLCIDVVTEVVRRAARSKPWQRFADAFHYRILERSPALAERQQRRLRGMDQRVVWTRSDLSMRRPARVPFAAHGMVIANEVLDCIAHHKIVASPGEAPNVVFVVPTVPAGVRARTVELPGVEGRALARADLDAFLADPDLAPIVSFEERQVPVSALPALEKHLQRHCPELFAEDHIFPPYFACPEFEPLMRNVATLYERCDALWVDYGELRSFHLSAAPEDRVFAGPPESGRSPYQAPGHDDITFVVDFTTVGEAAETAGWTVVHYGPQKDLADLVDVQLDTAARERIVAQRGLGFLLAVSGADAHEPWRRGGVTWRKGRVAQRDTVRGDAQRAIDEFLGKMPGHFKLMILRR